MKQGPLRRSSGHILLYSLQRLLAQVDVDSTSHTILESLDRLSTVPGIWSVSHIIFGVNKTIQRKVQVEYCLLNFSPRISLKHFINRHLSLGRMLLSYLLRVTVYPVRHYCEWLATGQVSLRMCCFDLKLFVVLRTRGNPSRTLNPGSVEAALTRDQVDLGIRDFSR